MIIYFIFVISASLLWAALGFVGLGTRAETALQALLPVLLLLAIGAFGVVQTMDTRAAADKLTPISASAEQQPVAATSVIRATRTHGYVAALEPQ